MRTGVAYLERKFRERRRNPKLRNYKREVRIFDAVVRQLNKCCSKYGMQKSIKNGCKDCPDKKKCVRLFEMRCEIKQSPKMAKI